MEQTEEVIVKPKKSKGQIYKETRGHSRRMARLTEKYKLGSLDEYRKLRLKKKKELRVKRQAKHATKKALRGVKNKG